MTASLSRSTRQCVEANHFMKRTPFCPRRLSREARGEISGESVRSGPEAVVPRSVSGPRLHLQKWRDGPSPEMVPDFPRQALLQDMSLEIWTTIYMQPFLWHPPPLSGIRPGPALIQFIRPLCQRQGYLLRSS